MNEIDSMTQDNIDLLNIENWEEEYQSRDPRELEMEIRDIQDRLEVLNKKVDFFLINRMINKMLIQKKEKKEKKMGKKKKKKIRKKSIKISQLIGLKRTNLQFLELALLS